MWVQVLLFFATIYALYKLVKPKRPKNFPPGPEPYPIVGSIFALVKLDDKIPVAVEKCGDIWGPVTGLWMGRQRVIIVNGWKTIKEVLNREEFHGRPEMYLAKHPKLGKQLGVLMVPYNDLWKTQRRFALRTLRDWGFGKKSLESVIHEEIHDTFEQLDKKRKISDDVISLDNAFGLPIVNILWAVIAGKRFHHDDEKLQDLLKKLYATFRSQSHLTNLINDYPFLRHLPIFSKAWAVLLEGKASIEEFLEETITEHMQTRDPSSPRDFIDEYLSQIEKHNGDHDSTFFHEQLVNLCSDLFSAGAESTSNSVAYSMLYLMVYPEIQEKMFQEINSVLGQHRLPSYPEDRTRLPYTEAVLCELQRVCNIAPTVVPHYTTQNTTLNGYSIPKDTTVFLSLTGIHSDPNLWEKPKEFNPQRFLDSEGKFKGKPEFLIPFGVGGRQCLGETLARSNYFIFVTAMIQRYRLVLPTGQPKPSLEPVSGFTYAPQPFKAHVVPRT